METFEEENDPFPTTVKKKKKQGEGFKGMGLSHAVIKGIQKRGYKVPTPIQRRVTVRITFESTWMLICNFADHSSGAAGPGYGGHGADGQWKNSLFSGAHFRKVERQGGQIRSQGTGAFAHQGISSAGLFFC